MARPRYPKQDGTRPDALPPETRTVGQLVAETLRLYGRRFWASVPLGIPVAAADQLSLGRPVQTRILVLIVLAPLFTFAYSVAVRISTPEKPSTRALIVALATGAVIFLPAAFFFPWFALAAVAWLGFAGLVVPVAMIEGAAPVAAVGRAFRLARADYIHALGSLATLVIVFVLTRLALGLLLQSQADNTLRIAVFLADLVLSPILFLGAALLYFDQVARVVVSGSRTRQ